MELTINDLSQIEEYSDGSLFPDLKMYPQIQKTLFHEPNNNFKFYSN